MQEIKPEMAWDAEKRALSETGNYTFNARDAVAALKVLAEVQGMKSEKLRLTGEADESLTISLKVVEE